MRLAAIDIGSNSIHMIVAEPGPGHLEVVDRAKEMVKLGAGAFSGRELTASAFMRGLDTLRRYVKLAEELGADEILAAATSAVREARNGVEFLERVYRESGVKPRLISGQEEGRLIFRAVADAIELQGKRALVCDVGGGSVEMVLGVAGEVTLCESLRLGVQRLLDQERDRGKMSGKRRRKLEERIRSAAGTVCAEARSSGFDLFVGTSGTMRALGEAAHLAEGGKAWVSVNSQEVPLESLEKLTDELVELDEDGRSKVPGIDEGRADTIHLGAVLVVQLMKLSGAKRLMLCDATLRDGLLLEHLDRHQRPIDRGASVRDRSILQLGRKHGAVGTRERHIAGLAQQMLDATSDRHELGDEARETLRHASFLHSIGRDISFRRHHKHARYLVRHAGLRGFTDREVEILGAIVRYQRKALPTKRHKSFRRLSREDRKTVELLAGILRVAIALDRGHNQAVKLVTVRPEADAGVLSLVLRGAGDLDLELWAARRRRRLMERALGTRITFELPG